MSESPDMDESFARAVVCFQKVCFDLRRKPPTPEEIQALREMFEKKGNKPMDEELFKRVEVDIEKFTRAVLELQVAVIDAEAQLKDAKQQWAEAEKALEVARLRWVDAEDTLEKARGQIRHHLDSVRGLKVTVPAPPDWGPNVYKVGERDA